MNLAFLKKIGIRVVDLFKNKGSLYLLFGGMAFASTVTAAACHIAYKKLEKKHREDDAEKYKAEFAKHLKELEVRYQHNEFLLKKKINELCDEFGIDHVY